MTTSENVQHLELIWPYYRWNWDTKSALLHIHEKFGIDSITESVIDFWYDRFDNLKVVPLDKDINEYENVLAIQALPDRDEV
jgi:hypothetical protein